MEQKLVIGHQNEETKRHGVDTEVKVKKTLADGNFELKLAPSKVKIEKKWLLEKVYDPSTIGTFFGRLEHKVGKDSTDLTAGFQYAVPAFHEGIGIWTEANLVSNNLKSWAGDASAMVNLNHNIWIGSKLIGDLQSQKLNEAHGVLAANFDGNFAYLVSNCWERKVRLGFSTPAIQYFNKLAAETKIDLDEKYAIKGTPESTVAFSSKLNDDSALKVKFDITKDVHVHFSFVHRINKNLQITVTDHANPMGFFKNQGDAQYKLGIALEAAL